jgi:hypothetical protein
MSTIPVADAPSDSYSDCALPYRQRVAVLWEWCLRREAFFMVPQTFLVAPLLIINLYCHLFWTDHWYANQGRDYLRILFAGAVLLVLGGGATHAAQAICWEVSNELRELVRLTGIGPLALLCCKSLARWVTIACSVLVLTPLVCFTMTLGGANMDQLAAYGWGLLMLTLLTASMAALAGVISTESANTATTAAMTTFILMMLYHMLFWLTALAILIATWLATGDWSAPHTSWWRSLADLPWQSAPVMVILQISSAPELFDPLSPSYWMHFLAAFCVFRYAAIIMINRFRSLTSTDHVESSEVSVGSVVTGRPRCGAAPLYWKDAYVLIGLRSQRSWSVVYFLLANVVVFSGLLQWNTTFPLAIGIIAECACPILFAVRFDSLLSSEFRQKTWHDLMLLPIDRSTVLWAKARAICWEHQLAALPVGIAVAFAALRDPTVIFMTGVIAALAGVLLCQVSAIYYVTAKHWWSGPIQMLGFLALVVFCAVIWVNFSIWPGFIMVVAILSVTTIPIQQFVNLSLDKWMESPEYQTKVSSS